MVEMIRALFATLWTDDDGQDLAEYALLLILVAVLIVSAVTAFRTQISTAFSRATAVLATTS
jgi:Flp pilus assembly pilin Flp